MCLRWFLYIIAERHGEPVEPWSSGINEYFSTKVKSILRQAQDDGKKAKLKSKKAKVSFGRLRMTR